MKKIIILGCAGSGKSVFARKLSSINGLQLTHLDNIWWKLDRTHISRAKFDAALNSILCTDAWIIDGDYSRTYEVRVKACDTIFFFDCSEEECMAGIGERIGKMRPDIPWTEDELDPELVDLVKKYRTENRPAVMGLLSRYPEKEIHIFHSREESATWLNDTFGAEYE